jgi:uncharacterized protein (DUF58 family)
MTASLRVVLSLFIASLIGLAVSGQSLYARLSYFWAILIVISWIWAKFSLYRLNFGRSTNIIKGEIGHIFREQFYLENLINLPRLWVEVVEHSKLPGSQAGRVHTLIGGKQSRSYMGRTRFVKRGAFGLGPTSLISGDPIGLFVASTSFERTAEVMVYPQVVDIDVFPGPAGLLPGGDALKRRTHQVTPNSASIREYTPGDSLNRIDWKSSARTDKLMVKEFELDPLAEVWIFVDGEEAVHTEIPHKLSTDVDDIIFSDLEAPPLPPTTEEYAVCASASIARYYLRRGRAVGLALLLKNDEVLPPDKGARQLEKIYERLAFFKTNGIMPFAGFVASQARRLTRGSTVVLVTPTVREDLSTVVDQLYRLGLKPVVILIDAKSFTGAPGTDRLAKKIGNMGVPLTVLKNEDNLGEKLSLTGWGGGAEIIAEHTLDLQ